MIDNTIIKYDNLLNVFLIQKYWFLKLLYIYKNERPSNKRYTIQ